MLSASWDDRLTAKSDNAAILMLPMEEKDFAAAAAAAPAEALHAKA